MQTDSTDRTVHHYCSQGAARWAGSVLEGCGLAPDDAATAARLLLRTSLRGIDSHGLARLPAYVQQLRAGATSVMAIPRITGNGAFLSCDGEGGLGQLAASAAMQAAIAQARDTPMVACTIGNAGHMGALGLYTLQASEQGLVAFMCQRTPPIMALAGAPGRAIGNNPLAFSLPLAGRAPLVFDMAASAAARGKIMAAARAGQASIPGGWAIDAIGAPTTDPAAALAGALLPMSAHKGIGLAMLVECLAGSLACNVGAAGLEQHDNSQGAARASAFLFVINPGRVCGAEAFDTSVREWLATYLEASGADGRYPGQRQAACEAHRVAHGIPIDAALVEELRVAGGSAGVAFDLAPLARPDR